LELDLIKINEIRTVGAFELTIHVKTLWFIALNNIMAQSIWKCALDGDLIAIKQLLQENPKLVGASDEV
jgi:hypothetical protein